MGRDLARRLTMSAVSAIADTVPTNERDAKAVRNLAVEMELLDGSMRGGRAWVERGVNRRTLLAGRG